MTTVSTATNSSLQQAAALARSLAAEREAASTASTDTTSSTSTVSAPSLTESDALDSGMLSYFINGDMAPPEEAPASSDTSSLSDTFSSIDGDGDGLISASEFEEAMGTSGLSEDEAASLYNSIDSDGNGISESEFETAVSDAAQSMAPPPPPESGASIQNTDSTTSTDTSSSTAAEAVATASFSDAAALLRAIDSYAASTLDESSGRVNTGSISSLA